MHLYGLVISQPNFVFALEGAPLRLTASQLRFSGPDGAHRGAPGFVMPDPGLRVMMRMNIHTQLMIHEMQMYADDARPAH